MADGRLAKDVQHLRRYIFAETNGQVNVTEVDDNLEFVHLDVLPNDGFYRGAKLRFKIAFDEDYPENVPQVLCLDRVYHPNIEALDGVDDDVAYGDGPNICVSLLDDWDSDMSLDHIVMAILFLLYNPNPDDALASSLFGPDMEEQELEENIRKALRGEEVGDVSWPRLLVEDEEDLCQGARANEEESVAEANNKKTSGKDEEVTNTTEDVSMEKSASEGDSVDRTVQPVPDCGSADESKDSDDQGLTDALTRTAGKDGTSSELLTLDSVKLILPTSPLVDGTPHQAFKESPRPVIDLDAADCDDITSDRRCCSGSVWTSRLFSCGSGIKALFSYFLPRGRTFQFQTTTSGAAVESEDFEVD